MDRKRSFKRRQKPPFAERAKEHCRQFTAFMFSNVGIIILVVVYMIGGASIFLTIEDSKDNYHKHLTDKMLALRENLTNQLWELTMIINTFNREKYIDQVGERIFQYQYQIVHAVNSGWRGSNANDSLHAGTWTFPTALLYSLTVITTIGYGITAPRTVKGKILTIFYAIIGMPLFLLYLSNIGDVLAKSFKWIYAKVCLCRICPGVAKRREIRTRRKIRAMTRELNDFDNDEDFNSDDLSSVTSTSSEAKDPNILNNCDASTSSSSQSTVDDTSTVSVPITTCLMIMIGYILVGALIFKKDLLNGCYFCFISLSSIGFGDIVPGDSSEVDAQFIICVIYLLLGMALIAMCFNLMQEQVINNMRTFKRGIQRCFRCHRCKSNDLD